MLQQQVYIINMVLMGLDALCVIAAGYSAYFLNFFLQGRHLDGLAFVASVIAIMFINNYFMGYFQLYSDRSPATTARLLYSIVKAVLMEFAGMTAVIFLLGLESYPRIFLLSFAAFTFLFLAGLRISARIYSLHVSKRGFHSRKILVIGDQERGEIVSQALENQLSWGHEVVGRLAARQEELNGRECLGLIDDLPQILRTEPIDEVVFALHGGRHVDLGPHLDICRKMGVAVRILPALWSPGGSPISVEKCQDIPFLNMYAGNFNANGLLYKRTLDIVGGMAGFLFFLLLFPFVAIAIKLDSPGPVLFTQLRKGQHGRIFKLYKFRTMHENAEHLKKELLNKNEMQGAMFKLQDDPRITRVGRWLRKTSLDEFPQFINVLKGEMSLVGTRPPTVDEVERYQPEHLKRIAAKPGITGMWQVSGRNKITDFEQVVALDCMYLENWQFSNDIKILLKTVFVVLQRKGAL